MKFNNRPVTFFTENFMIWFKNAIIYQIDNNDNNALLNRDRLEAAVKSVPFTACGSLDTEKMGWVSPYNDKNQNDFIIDVQGQLLLRIKKETKVLPSPVIKQALLEKIDKQEQALSRRLTKNEKATLKDEVMIDLTPRAFSKYTHCWVWIDTVNKRIIFDASSFKQAEDILAILRKEMGALALTPLSIEKPLEQIMTIWVREKLKFAPFILGDQAELKDPLECNGVINCKNQEITSAEMSVHFDSGKWVTKLKIIDERGVSYVLHSNFTFKQIRFDPNILDENEYIPVEYKTARVEADFFLMSKTLSNSINDIKNVFEQII